MEAEPLGFGCGSVLSELKEWEVPRVLLIKIGDAYKRKLVFIHSFTYSFILPSIQYLVSQYYMPGTVPGAWIHQH